MEPERKAAAFDRLLAAAIPVTLRLAELTEDPGPEGQGYRVERLVQDCERLRAVVRDLSESTGSSGSVLPA